MTKRSILTMVVLVAAVALVAPAASAQTTLNIQNGTVVGVWDNTLVIRDSNGVSRQFDVSPDFKVDVDGKSVSVKELRPGMHITAAVRTVNTPVVVQSKELRDATYIKHAGALVYVKEADGIHSYNTPAGFRFWINNAPLRPDDLQTNMKLNATIVHTGTATGTSQELAGASRDRRSRQGGGGEGGGGQGGRGSSGGQGGGGQGRGRREGPGGCGSGGGEGGGRRGGGPAGHGGEPPEDREPGSDGGRSRRPLPGARRGAHTSAETALERISLFLETGRLATASRFFLGSKGRRVEGSKGYRGPITWRLPPSRAVRP